MQMRCPKRRLRGWGIGRGDSIVRIVVLIVNEIEINLKFDAQAAIMFCSHFERQPTKIKVKQQKKTQQQLQQQQQQVGTAVRL